MSTADRTGPASAWFRSSYSNGAGGECVECAYSADGTLIRDSKRAEGPVVHVRAGAWSAFVRSLTRDVPR
ncbi:DUF397 domain-containing protein [Streptomyces sp. P9-A2]|uniref:DUF397 domain-containing protein n=1 Tax=Streptomyces sp. P9-A2 TaxID=3072284 RepID=UPI002FCBF035